MRPRHAARRPTLDLRTRRRLGRAVLRARRARLHLGARQCRPGALARDPRRARGGRFRPRPRARRHDRRLRDDAHEIRQRRQRHRGEGGAGADRIAGRPVRLPGLPALDAEDKAALAEILPAGACCRARPRRSRTARRRHPPSSRTRAKPARTLRLAGRWTGYARCAQ